jgi:hypothetical protein
MEIGWTDVGSGGYILVSRAHSNTSLEWRQFNLYHEFSTHSTLFRYVEKEGGGNYRSNDQVLFCYLIYAFLLLGGAEATDNQTLLMLGVFNMYFSFKTYVFQADLVYEQVISKTHKGVPYDFA